MASLTDIPHNLPAPKDDGACDHLLGATIPSLDVPSTDNKNINLSRLPRIGAHD